MENLEIGKIHEKEQNRDAVHMAIAPVVAGERLRAGKHIAIVDGKAFASLTPIGIVDPFLAKPVAVGQKFWLFLYPGSITSLRHEWSHPAFGLSPITESDKEQAKKVFERLTGIHEKWLRDFVSKLGTDISYEEIIERALEDPGYMSFGDDISGDIPDEFWDHVEAIAGKRITERASYFSCAC